MIFVSHSMTFLGCIISSIMHELGHLIIMRLQNKQIYSIHIGLFNIDIKHTDYFNLNDEIVLLLSGSGMNFLISLLTYLINMNIKSYNLYIFALQNIIIGIFNLLPIANLDGGQIFYMILNKKFSLRTAKIISNVVSLAMLIPIFILSFTILFNSAYNFSLLFVFLYLIIFILFR